MSTPARDRPTILFVGHSHLQALRAGFRARPEGARPFVMAEIGLLDPHWQPNIREGALNPAIARVLAADRVAAVVSVVAGNSHHSFGMVNRPRPVDVALPGCAPVRGDQRTEFLPTGLVERQIARMDAEALAVLRALRRATARPVLHLQSPPPIASEAHLRAHPRHFAPLIARYGLAPRDRALRFWRVQEDLMRRVCTAEGIGYVPAPPAMLTEAGLLAQTALGDDPTHANSVYGSAVLDMLAARLPTPPP